MDDPDRDIENLGVAIDLLRTEADLIERVEGPNAASLVLRRRADRLEAPLLARYGPEISAWIFNLGSPRA